MVLPNYQCVTLLAHVGAGSGLGGKVVQDVAERARALFGGATFEVVETKSREHIEDVGSTSTADLIICLSGDGSLHTLAQPLIARTEAKKPTLAAIPAGSGNDYARTLGMPADPLEAVALLPQCQPLKADVGRVNSTYFLETLSFGIDAAVALNTEELRLATKARGTLLYAHAAINAILHEFNSHDVKVTIDEREFSQNMLILAVQNGPTYGSGFKVAPRASIVDGMLDMYVISGVSKPVALYYLSRMKAGTHENLKGVSYFKTPRVELEFAEQLPIQCDGERILGETFLVEVVPAALDVLALPTAPACSR